MSVEHGWLESVSPPHGGQVVHTYGAPLDKATGAVIMLHGRGASAASILELARLLEAPGVAFVAPQASDSTWYPYSFLESRDLNEPGLSSAHAVIATLSERLTERGIDADRQVLLGFSQGACLATDHAALNPRRYGGVIGFSGGLIGSQVNPSRFSGSLDGTPVFLGCSDIDAHIPVERVHETAQILQDLDASVTTSIYPGMGHTVNSDEIEHARNIIQRLESL